MSGLSSLVLLLSCAGDRPADPSATGHLGRVGSAAAPTDLPATDLPSADLSPRLVPSPGSRFARATLARPLEGGTLTEAGVAGLHHVPGLRPSQVRSMVLQQVLPLPQGGGVLRYQAQVDGAPVLDSEVRLLVDGAHRLRAASWGAAIEAGLESDSKAGPALLDAAGAVAAAVLDRSGARLAVQVERERGGWTELAPGSGAGLHLSRARARPAWLQEEGLRPVWEVELWWGEQTGTDSQAWALVIDGRTGRVLRARDLRVHSEPEEATPFDYTVWADPALRPLDSPLADVSPHPTGTPDGSFPEAVAPSTVTVAGLNTNPDGEADPWLPAGASTTTGNNADAYADHYGPDGYTEGRDGRAALAEGGGFTAVYDTSASPLADEDQLSAAITQAFYTVNWLHDWYYDQGFTEALGNAQTDNFDRGGTGGDPLLIEAQDDAYGGSTNNANMSTPGDGSSPRMQIYLWSARSSQALSVSPGGLELEVATAAFGPTRFDLTADLALPGGDPLGCTLDSAGEGSISGAIVLVDRGTCPFVEKARQVQAAGGLGLLVANDSAGGGLPPLGGAASDVTIPVLGISYEDGQTLRTLLAGGADTGSADTGGADTGGSGEVTATMLRDPGVQADGALDNTVVAHEWGHYLLGRLLGCGTTQCGGINEGHADFVALAMMLREEDDLLGAYAVGTYATGGYATDPSYFGIRRAPYSVDPAINALSFRHIGNGVALPDSHPLDGGGWNNAEVHNAGEIWASAMHDAQVAILSARDEDGRSFEQAQARISQILVAGLALAPNDTTYTELRDSLLAAAAVDSPTDAERIAQAFAGRGIGTCAISPARGSTDLTDLVEDTGLSPLLSISDPALIDDVASCDGDGLLDGGEVGSLQVTLSNLGPEVLAGTTVTFAFAEALPDLVLLAGDTVAAPDLEPFTSTVMSLPVQMPRGALTSGATTLTVTAINDTACVTEEQTLTWTRTETDVRSAASAAEGFAADDGSWTVEGDDAGEIWRRQDRGLGDSSWVGEDVSGVTDSRLVSPELVVSKDVPLAFVLSHRYRFEHDGTTAWDGGVIELSVDGGEWTDISTWVDPGYDAVLTTSADNPLGDRWAFTASSDAWPELEELRLELGEALAGRSLRFSLRVGTDQAVADEGWELDALSVEGLVNTPFPAIEADATDCNPAPVADAGEDQVVEEGDVVTLDGSASFDPAGEALTWEWTVVSGEGVTLSGTDSAAPTFTAPEVEGDSVIELLLTVDDGLASATDTVIVTVLDTTVAGDGGTTDGGTTDGGTADGGTTDGGSSGGTTDGGTTDGGSSAEDEGGDKSGCGCQGGPLSAAWWAPALLLGLRRRR